MNTKQLNIKHIRKADISQSMFGLYFEDTNYSDDGGIYAQMIENRAFEYTPNTMEADSSKQDGRLYGWQAYPLGGLSAELRIDTEAPVDPLYPHYLNFTSTVGQLGFMNKAYNGVTLRKGISYKISCYMRTREEYDGTVEVSIRKDGVERTCAMLAGHVYPDWRKYEAVLELSEDIEGGEFVIMLSFIGNVDFDYISMVPEDAVAGVFRKDLVDYLAKLKPDFVRFPIGYAFHSRRKNVGALDYFRLCRYLHAKPIPVANVGLWDTDFSRDTVEGFIQQALNLIQYAEGNASEQYENSTRRKRYSRVNHLEYIKIGNDAHETENPDYLRRYALFEQAIHEKYPHMKLIASAGPDANTPQAMERISYFSRKKAENPNFVYAVDLNQDMSRQDCINQVDSLCQFLPNNLLYNNCSHASKIHDLVATDSLEAALATAAVLTQIEQHAAIMSMTNASPVIARTDYRKDVPYIVRFNDTVVYGTPAFYVYRAFASMKQDYLLESEIAESLGEKHLFHSVGYSPTDHTISIKVVNLGEEGCKLKLNTDNLVVSGDLKITRMVLAGEDIMEKNAWDNPKNVTPVIDVFYEDDYKEVEIPPHSFTYLFIEN